MSSIDRSPVRRGCGVRLRWTPFPPAPPRPPRLRVSFLGEEGPYCAVERFRQSQPVFARRGSTSSGRRTWRQLNPRSLEVFDAAALCNIENIEPRQEQALLDYVASGKGFVPIHCGSLLLSHSPKYVELVEPSSRRHGTGDLHDPGCRAGARSCTSSAVTNRSRSWDETYVHHRRTKPTASCSNIATRKSSRAVDLGSHSRKGTRLLHRLGTRRPHVGTSRFSDADRAGLRWAAGGRSGVVPAVRRPPR